MGFLGYEKPVGLGKQQVFDPTTAQMVLNANRDYINAVYNDYLQAKQEMKDFQKTYGDFASPFAKDMQRYNEIVGGIRNGINQIYDSVGDPLRSSEGRAALSRLLMSVNPAELSAMRANAKIGYAYLDAMQALRKAGKYSRSQEDFDIAYNNETAFDDFATNAGNGSFNTWRRSSPIQAATLRDLAFDSYKNRTPRVLTKEDFKNDPRLAGYEYDPRYEYTGYLYSDLLKGASGASASLIADPRAAYFRDLARQRAIAANPNATEDDIEAQWQRDIADSQTWALVDPIRKADEYAKLDHQYELQSRLKAQEAAYEAAKDANKNTGDGISDPYSMIVFTTAGAQKLRWQTDAIKPFQKDYESLKTITDPAEYSRKKAQLDGRVMRKWLSEKQQDGHSRYYRIMMAGNSNNADINTMLDSRSVGGSQKLDGAEMLEMAGWKANEDGWYERGGNSSELVSPNQILANIIKYEGGDFNITERDPGMEKLGISGKKVSKQKIVEHLLNLANTDASWVQATTNERIERTDAVKPQTSDGNGYIIAPNAQGIPTLYMKVEIEQGARFLNPGSWLPQGNHGGYWVAMPMQATPRGDLALENVPSVFSQDLSQRKNYGDAASTHASENARY